MKIYEIVSDSNFWSEALTAMRYFEMLPFFFTPAQPQPPPFLSIGAQIKVHGILWDAHEFTVAQVKR